MALGLICGCATYYMSAYANHIKAWSGHIVVRVAKNGDYTVFVLDDTDRNYKVKSIHGPYKSE